MTPDGTAWLSVLEAAQITGRAVGLVATSAITDATPASFASHVESRGMQGEIAAQLLANRVNVMFGGGERYFLPEKAVGGKREDGRHLIREAEEAGYACVRTAQELRSAHGPYVLGLFQLGPLTTQPPEPSLAELMRAAIKNPRRH